MAQGTNAVFSGKIQANCIQVNFPFPIGATVFTITRGMVSDDFHLEKHRITAYLVEADKITARIVNDKTHKITYHPVDETFPDEATARSNISRYAQKYGYRTSTPI